MTPFDKLFRRTPKDPYWDRFISGPINDPLNDASDAYRNAPAGDVFPVKSDVPDPARMARDLAQFAIFMGARSLAVTATDAGTLRPAGSQGPGELAEQFPYAIVLPVPATVDPETATGVGGQQPRRMSALVNHAVSSYIRELGYGAVVCPIETGGYQPREHVFVGDAVLTEIPLAVGSPNV